MGVLVVFLIVILIYLLYKYLQLKSDMNKFSEYINYAIAGKLKVDEFDEREISKLKSKLLKFLTANQIKESNLLQEQEKIRDLIADISHQTKTPITNLSLYISLLEREYKEEYIDIIKYELNKLEFLIKNLVKSSRLESDMIVLQKKEVNLADLVREVINEFREILLSKKIEISYRGEDLFVNLDERWMKEAINNLLDNSIKYSPENKCINISVYKSYLNYNVDIENDCENLSYEDLNKIFKRFNRGKNSISKDGLGLGLYITREIIAKHDGNIKASLNNNRIKFSVDFPL